MVNGTVNAAREHAARSMPRAASSSTALDTCARMPSAPSAAMATGSLRRASQGKALGSRRRVRAALWGSCRAEGGARVLAAVSMHATCCGGDE